VGGFPEWVGCETIVYTVQYIHGSKGTFVKMNVEMDGDTNTICTVGVANYF
jgi:hypothetical protein